MKYWIVLCTSVVLSLMAHSQSVANQLANTTVLIIRHAEKADWGPGLSPEGVHRAQHYARYFEPFTEQGLNVRVNSLFAGADSQKSMRPRLTLEPLSQATGLPVNTRFSTDSSEALAHALSTEHHGNHLLIAWRHNEIPALLQALGADPNILLPNGIWPTSVYDWVVLLNYDSAGHLQTQKIIHQTL